MSDIEARLRDLGDRVGASVAGAPMIAPSVLGRARLRRAVAALSAVALTAVAGTGVYLGLGTIRGGNPVGGEGVLVAAAEATAAQGTARATFSMTGTFEGPSGTDQYEMTGTSEIDFAAGRSYTRMESSSASSSLPRLTLEQIQDGEVAYSREGGSEWHRFDNPAAGQMTGAQDPSGWLEQIGAFSQDVQVAGEEVVRGVPTTHYVATFDETVIKEAFEPSMGARIEMDPLDIWVDADGLVRKMAFGMSSEGTGTTSFAMDMTFTTSFYDFGAPVEIDVPDPSEVTESNGGILESIRESAGSTGGSLEVEEAPRDKPVFVVGEEEFEGPQLLFFDLRFVCVDGLAKSVTVVEIVAESSTSTVLTLVGEEGMTLGQEGAAPSPRTIFCDPIREPLARAISRNPSAYSLIVSSDGDDIERIELLRKIDVFADHHRQ